MASPPAHTVRKREQGERGNKIFFQRFCLKCCDVYSQRVALWGQILALSFPLPLLPNSLVCFLEKWRVGEREGDKEREREREERE